MRDEKKRKKCNHFRVKKIGFYSTLPIVVLWCRECGAIKETGKKCWLKPKSKEDRERDHARWARNKLFFNSNPVGF